MWYFAWILGLPLAAAFAVLNAMWFELMEDETTRHDRFDPARSASAARAPLGGDTTGPGRS